MSAVTVQTITPSNPGGLTVNSAGVVTVASTVPANTYTVTIRATDNCGAFTDAPFTLGIVKATPTITWANPADITYGTALSATQLNATANVAGSFVYTPASGSVLNAGTAQSLSVTFTPTDTTNYSTASKTVALNVLKATPTITWNNPADITYGTALSGTQLNATASVAGSFVYTPASGSVLNAGPQQTLAVTFTPTNANYSQVSGSVKINVLKAASLITWNAPAFLVAGNTLSATELNATANVPGTFSYNPAAGTVLSAGTLTIAATFTPTNSGNYSAASQTVAIPVLNTCGGTTVNPATLAQAVIGIPYAQVFSASPVGSYTFSLLAGTLPPGLQITNVLGIYTLVGIPTTPGTYNFTIKGKKSNSTCEGARSYTITIAPTVAPLLNCVLKNANGTYTAKFGYDNTTGAAVTIPVGANNYFTPDPQNRGQVTTFQPGRVNNAFSVTFAANGSNLGIWLLKGPDGVLRPVNITTATLGCP